MPGPARQFDAEEFFQLVYNGGQRRTKAQAIEQWRRRHPGEDPPSMAALARYAAADDWKGRAERLDADVREAMNARLVDLTVKARTNHAIMAATVAQRFLNRLKALEGEKGYLAPEEIDWHDAVEAAKLFELLTGGATERHGLEGVSTVPLEEVEAELEEIEIRALQRETRMPIEPRSLPPVLEGHARGAVRNPSVVSGKKMSA